MRKPFKDLFNKVDFYFLFPLKKSPTEQIEKTDKKQKGIALFIALMTISMMIMMIADMIISSSVNLELSISTRDRIKSEYLAKSGQNLAVFLTSASWGIDLFRASDLAGPAKAEPSDSDSSLWASLNKLPPIGSSTVKLALAATKGDEDPLGIKGIFSEDLANQMQQFEDSFSIKITDESSKINLSLCKKQTTCPIDQMISLFSCPAEKAFLEKYNLTPETLAYRIYDFISEGDKPSQQSGYSDKDSPYSRFQPPYKARRMPLDSVEELKLVEGFNDAIYDVFSPYLTVYPYYARWTNRKAPGININTAKTELLSCLLPHVKRQENFEKFTIDMIKTKKQGTAIAERSEDLPKILKDKFFYTSDSEEESALKREDWFTQRTDTFRIEVQAETGQQQITSLSVIRRINPKETDFSRDRQQTKRSYQILYNRLQ